LIRLRAPSDENIFTLCGQAKALYSWRRF